MIGEFGRGFESSKMESNLTTKNIFMAKKNEVKKLSPGGSLRSLQAYHESVLQLVTAINAAREFIDPKVRDIILNVVNNIKEFYDT